MHLERTLEILERLVGFDTVSSNSNLELIRYAEETLAGAGVEVQVIPAPTPGKASLWASLGPQTGGGIAFSGHSDVVPVQGQDWHTNPFHLTPDGTRVYGRGTSDMKGFIACAMAAMERADGDRLAHPLHLAITYDEEIGCLGAPKLIDWISDQGVDVSAVLVGEPTNMKVVHAHKGISVLKTHIRGLEAHSSLAHKGVSAVDLAGRFIAILKSVEADLRAQTTNPRFVPGYTTITANQIAGGEATNILAGHCVVDWDIRTIPEMTADEVRAMIADRVSAEILDPVQAQFPTAQIETEIVADAPPLVPLAENKAEALATRLTGDNAAEVAPYAAEAGQYQSAGYPCVLIGPGSIEQAHQPNEFIETSELSACNAFLSRLVEDASR